MSKAIHHCLIGFALLAAACNSTHKPHDAVTHPYDTVASPPTTIATTAPASPTINRWQKEIDAYLDADRAELPAQGGIVFAGSSSIRGWKTLKQDFPDLNVIGRGFGGSSTIDVVRYADVLVLKHRPRIIVFYCGENDLTAPRTTPADVFRHFTTFVDLVHRELPATKIVFISLKPSPSRFALIDKFRETNALVKGYIETDPRLAFVDVFTPMLDDTGQPREELFLKDRLHMKPAGYELWTKLVRPFLD